ncbi:MAG: amino acid--tRNA ligase-related protein [Desulfobacterales bacterium]|nr:amino acid--tRNA ligase-related protein [Desulfobacterales bacterium]
MHQFFREKGFQYINTPIITGSDCEGAANMFRITTLDLDHLRAENLPLDNSRDFFGKKVNLTVSGQLSAEMFALALGNVYYLSGRLFGQKIPTPDGMSPNSGWSSRKWRFATYRKTWIWPKRSLNT